MTSRVQTTTSVCSVDKIKYGINKLNALLCVASDNIEMDEREDPGTVEQHAGTRRTSSRPNADMVDFLNAGPSQSANRTNQSNGFGMTERVSVDHEPSGWKARYTAAKPDPWIQMKFGVLSVDVSATSVGEALKADLSLSLVLALSVWSFYVMVGRICNPMIQRKSSTGLERGAGSKLQHGEL